MLRQGSSSAFRLLNHGAASSGLLAALNGGARPVLSEIASEGQVITSSVNVQACASQFSTATAAALASKQAHVTGDVISLGRSIRGFASSGLAPVGSAASAAPAAAAAQAEAKQPSLLSRLAKAAAVTMGALLLATTGASADSPEPWQMLFQDSANSTAQAMQDLHHDIMFFLITIVTVVAYLLWQIGNKFHYSKQLKPEKLTHHTTMEVIWTIIPTLIVLSIAIPSLTLIYSLDQHTDRPGLTVKVIGRQWYWSYEMNDHLQQKLLDPDRLVALAEKSVLKA